MFIFCIFFIQTGAPAKKTFELFQKIIDSSSSKNDILDDIKVKNKEKLKEKLEKDKDPDIAKFLALENSEIIVDTLNGKTKEDAENLLRAYLDKDEDKIKEINAQYPTKKKNEFVLWMIKDTEITLKSKYALKRIFASYSLNVDLENLTDEQFAEFERQLLAKVKNASSSNRYYEILQAEVVENIFYSVIGIVSPNVDPLYYEIDEQGKVGPFFKEDIKVIFEAIKEKEEKGLISKIYSDIPTRYQEEFAKFGATEFVKSDFSQIIGKTKAEALLIIAQLAKKIIPENNLEQKTEPIELQDRFVNRYKNGVIEAKSLEVIRNINALFHNEIYKKFLEIGSDDEKIIFLDSLNGKTKEDIQTLVNGFGAAEFESKVNEINKKYTKNKEGFKVSMLKDIWGHLRPDYALKRIFAEYNLDVDMNKLSPEQLQEFRSKLSEKNAGWVQHDKCLEMLFLENTNPKVIISEDISPKIEEFRLSLFVAPFAPEGVVRSVKVVKEIREKNTKNQSQDIYTQFLAVPGSDEEKQEILNSLLGKKREDAVELIKAYLKQDKATIEKVMEKYKSAEEKVKKNPISYEEGNEGSVSAGFSLGYSGASVNYFPSEVGKNSVTSQGSLGEAQVNKGSKIFENSQNSGPENESSFNFSNTLCESLQCNLNPSDSIPSNTDGSQIRLYPQAEVTDHFVTKSALSKNVHKTGEVIDKSKLFGIISAGIPIKDLFLFLEEYKNLYIAIEGRISFIDVSVAIVAGYNLGYKFLDCVKITLGLLTFGKFSMFSFAEVAFYVIKQKVKGYEVFYGFAISYFSEYGFVMMCKIQPKIINSQREEIFYVALGGGRKI